MNNKIIAMCGKGGVGKTSISAVMVKILSETFPAKRILAIDADPSIGLATALGVQEKGTINDIREEFIQLADQRKDAEAIEMLHEAKDRIFDSLVETDSFSFLAIGRPESAGCYCSVNDYLRDLITLVADHFDYVVIDGEAGIEQINRRVMEKVSHLVFVTDASRRGLDVIKTIDKVARELVMYEKAGIIVNRIHDLQLAEHLDTGDLPLLAAIGEDEIMQYYDIEGRSVLDLPDSTRIYQGVYKALEEMRIIE